MKIIYVTDLDGTLLKEDGLLSDYSRGKIERLIERGINFTVASARSVVTMRESVGDISLNLPVIAYNGVFISDLSTGQHLVINKMEPDMLAPIVEMASQHSCETMISTVSNGDDHLFYSSSENEAMQRYVAGRKEVNDPRIRHVEDITDAFAESAVSFVFVDRFEKLKKVSDDITRRFEDRVEINFFENVYQPGWYWMTMHHQKASKDQAISRVIEDHGLSDCELVVFGDNFNDIKMFKLASRAIAVENAVPELKELATEIIGPNKSDSVIDYIENDFNQ